MEPRTPQHVYSSRNSDHGRIICPHPPQRHRVEEIPDERLFPLFPLPLEQEEDDERIIVHSLQKVSLQPRNTTYWKLDTRSPERRSTRHDHQVRECPKIPLSVDPEHSLRAPSHYLSMKPHRKFM